MITIEIIGLIAGFLTTGAMIPQAIQVYRTKQTRDLNLTWLTTLWAGTLLWFVYGLYINSIPLIIFNALSLFIVGYMVWQKSSSTPINYRLLSEFFDQKTANKVIK